MSMYGKPRLVTKCEDKSLTRQSEAEACDINVIVRKYEVTGVMPAATREALFLDVSEMPDYRQAVEQVAQVRRYFETLKPEIREAFANDPAVFLDAVNNPANQDALVELGVLAAKPAAAPTPVAPEEPASPA